MILSHPSLNPGTSRMASQKQERKIKALSFIEEQASTARHNDRQEKSSTTSP